MVPVGGGEAEAGLRPLLPTVGQPGLQLPVLAEAGVSRQQVGKFCRAYAVCQERRDDHYSDQDPLRHRLQGL